MKSLQVVLRVKQRELDVLKRQQAVIENQRQDVINRIARLEKQLGDEMATAEAMPQMAHFFGDFASSIKKRQEQMRVQLTKLEAELDKISVQIFDRFSEMKKFELAIENDKRRRAQIAATRAQQYMDEIAIRGYIRRDAN